MSLRLLPVTGLAAVVLSVGSAQAKPVEQLTVMTFHTWDSTDEFNDGTAKAVDAILHSGADVVALQDADEVANELALELGWWVYHAGWGAAVISRFPITQGFLAYPAVGARIQLSDSPPQDVIVWSVELDSTPYGPYLLQDGAEPRDVVWKEYLQSDRMYETREILWFMKHEWGHIYNADNVPVFLMGDFESPSHLDWTVATAARHDGNVVRWPVTQLLENEGFRDVYREAWPDPLVQPGHTWSPIMKGSEPQDRIDMVHTMGAGVTVASAEVYTGPPGVTRLYPVHEDNTWPSFHAAVVAEVELVPGSGLPLPPIDQPSITVADVLVGEDVVVQFENTLGFSDDWVGLFEVGAADDDYFDYAYTGGGVSGTVTLSSLAFSGTYEARLFIDDSYGRMAETTFEVGSP